MIADIGTVRALFEDLATVPDDIVQTYLDDAAVTLSASAWGLCFVKAQLYYAAHHCALYRASVAPDAESRGVGAIQSASAEGLSVTFAAPAGRGESQLWWAQTPYGTSYLALQRQCLRQSRTSW